MRAFGWAFAAEVLCFAATGSASLTIGYGLAVWLAFTLLRKGQCD
jgi:hypothetical protein